MAITNMDQLVAGMVRYPRVFGKDIQTAEAAGIPHTPWYGSGITGSGISPTGINGITFVGPAIPGQIAQPATVTGLVTYLSRWSMTHTGGIGHVWLIDRLWGNVPVITTTGAQAVTSPAWPARDNSASVNGDGVLLAMECSATTGNAGAITGTTVSYTNSAGTATRTANLPSWPITGVTGTFVPFALQGADVGVRSVQSVTLSTSYISGAVHVMAFRLIAELEIPTANVGAAKSFTGLNLPYIGEGGVLQLVYFPTGTAIGSVAGSLSYAQG